MELKFAEVTYADGRTIDRIKACASAGWLHLELDRGVFQSVPASQVERVLWVAGPAVA